MVTYDTILYIEPAINEADPRSYAKRVPVGNDYGLDNKTYIDWNDPRLWTSTAFGRVLQSSLTGMGAGFSAQVTDFKRWVTVVVSYQNLITGKGASKHFLVVFDKPDKPNGMVMSTANRYRSISGVDQAASYIKSASYALKDQTN